MTGYLSMILSHVKSVSNLCNVQLRNLFARFCRNRNNELLHGTYLTKNNMLKHSQSAINIKAKFKPSSLVKLCHLVTAISEFHSFLSPSEKDYLYMYYAHNAPVITVYTLNIKS